MKSWSCSVGLGEEGAFVVAFEMWIELPGVRFEGK